jgi:hypothetical protein
MDIKPTLSSDTMQEKQDHGWNNNSKFWADMSALFKKPG